MSIALIEITMVLHVNRLGNIEARGQRVEMVGKEKPLTIPPS